MRRAVVILAPLAVCALFATRASGQTHNSWFLNADVGPSFGTLGSTAAADVSGGYKLTDHVSLAAEFGALPHEPVDKAGGVAPSVSPFVPSSGVHVNAYHTNANLFVQPSPLGRLVPYATAGFGTFTGSTVASTELSGSHFVQYSRETNPATNLGAGATYRLTNWLGLSGDYRHFIVSATDTEHVNRFTAGVSFFVRAPVVK